MFTASDRCLNVFQPLRDGGRLCIFQYGLDLPTENRNKYKT